MNPCQAIRCSYCCQHTNMLLTAEDTKRIEALGHPPATFQKPGALGMQLKNTHGHCVFLKNGQCTIYDARPQGCRLYPIIHNRTLGGAICDDACPRHTDFPLTPETRRQLRRLIETLFPDGL